MPTTRTPTAHAACRTSAALITTAPTWWPDLIAQAYRPRRPVDPYYDGARKVDPYYDGARTLAGMDRTGVSADPARKVDPYLDGAYA